MQMRVLISSPILAAGFIAICWGLADPAAAIESCKRGRSIYEHGGKL